MKYKFRNLAVREVLYIARIKVIFILYLIGSLTGSCSRKEKEVQKKTEFSNPYVNDKTTYELINAVLSQTSNNHNPVCNKVVDKDLEEFTLTSKDSSEIASLDSLFSKQDITFIYQQIPYTKRFKINPNLINNRRVVSLDSILSDQKEKKYSIHKAFKERYGEYNFCFINMPLFTKDKSIAIIERGKICGLTCGEIETLIYKKINKEWKEIYTLVHSPEI